MDVLIQPGGHGSSEAEKWVKSPVFVLFPLHLTLQSSLAALPFCGKSSSLENLSRFPVTEGNSFSHLRGTLEQLGEPDSQLGSSPSWVRPGVMKTYLTVPALPLPCLATAFFYCGLKLK